MFSEILNESHSRFRFDLKVKRKTGYYVWNIIFPIILIVMVSFSTFWISPVHRVAQIALASTAFLTLVVFGFRISALVPNIPYLTHLGFFGILSMGAVFLALIETVATGILAGEEKEEAAKKLDRWSRVVLPVAFTTLAVIIFST